jgi:hypothetical protein
MVYTGTNQIEQAETLYLYSALLKYILSVSRKARKTFGDLLHLYSAYANVTNRAILQYFITMTLCPLSTFCTDLRSSKHASPICLSWLTMIDISDLDWYRVSNCPNHQKTDDQQLPQSELFI